MDTKNKETKYNKPVPDDIFAKQKGECNKDGEDAREIIGVDDKLIGDDLDIDEAHLSCRDKEAGPANGQVPY